MGGSTVAVTLPHLPPQLATHFDVGGTPNAWSSHAGYVVVLTVVGFLLPLGIVRMVGWFGAVRPELLNVPYREYWLDPSRRAEGMRRIEGHMWWLACLMAALVVGIHLLLVQAHSTTPPHLRTGPFYSLLAAFLAGLATWIAAFYALLRPPGTR
ncbi:MAG TPA: DUF1648 domain-containing protein [Gemmatimonadales bacterium]|nr:DUF1648 domain-containing protein [Gemmatimonadales bacterium]